MNTALKKIMVFLPVLLLSVLFFHTRIGGELKHLNSKRWMLFGAELLLFYGWIILEIILRKQRSIVQMGVQSSYYVYIFMVLTLTGYFILFKEISTHHWWQRMVLRVERKDHVNLRLFEVFKIYKITDLQVVGNFIMLFPLGIYLPLLYKRVSGFFTVTFICMITSVSIELLQLLSNYRSTDIDDVFLNTLGACMGYIVYRVIKYSMSKQTPVNSPRLTVHG